MSNTELQEVRNPKEMELREKYGVMLSNKLTGRHAVIAGVSVLGVVAALPLLYLAIQAISAAIVGGVLVTGGVIAYKWIPNLINKMDNRIRESNMIELNRHLAALKAEAQRNPIETLENELLLMCKQRDGLRVANQQFGAVVQSYRDELAESKRADPTIDYTNEDNTADEMQRVCEEQLQLFAEFVQGIQLFEKKIGEAKKKWNLAVKANAAFDLLDANAKGDKMRGILMAVSFDEVRNQYSGIFARVNTRAAELSGTRSIKIGSATVDVSNIQIPEVNRG